MNLALGFDPKIINQEMGSRGEFHQALPSKFGFSWRFNFKKVFEILDIKASTLVILRKKSARNLIFQSILPYKRWMLKQPGF